MSNLPRVAVVVPSLAAGGGVSTMARFIYRTLAESGEFRPEYISLATSARDMTSVRLLSPRSWLRGPQVTSVIGKDGSYLHVGCTWAELEFQRYQPRRILTELLQDCDLIQVVAGGPAAGGVATQSSCPVCLFVATTTARERPSLLAKTSGLRRIWLKSMTRLTVSIERKVLPRMSHVFAESDYTRRLVAPYTPAERLSVGAPGVDTARFKSRGYHADGYLLAVGRWSDPRKNVRLLFEAYRELCLSMPHAPRLLLVGQSGPCTDDWAFAQDSGIADKIEFRESVAAEQLPEVYQRASLFVLSSDEEGLGIVILEAMASGLPVVSTRCGGPESAVVHRETGILTPIGDAKAMAQVMYHLIMNPTLREEMGATGRDRVERFFSLPVAGRTYLDQYHRLLSAM